VDPTIGDEAFKSYPGDLPPDGIENRKNDRFRSIVHDKVNAGGAFEGTDVSTFPADDPSLHLIAWKVDYRHCLLGDIISRVPLDGEADDLLGLFIGCFLSLFLHPFDGFCQIDPGFFYHHGLELFLGLVSSHLGDLLKFDPLLIDGGLKFFLLVSNRSLLPRNRFFTVDQVLLFFVQVIEFFVQVLVALGKTSFQFLHLALFFPRLLFQLGPGFQEKFF